MKNKVLVLLAIIAGIWTINACDIIDNPFPKKRVATFVDTVGLDSIAALQAEPSNLKKVLLEDFTGHQCGNCPRAHEDAAALAAQYGDRLIIVGMHIGFFARTNTTGKYTVDYKTEAGTAYGNEWGIDALGLPQGMVDRVPLTGANPAITRGSWPTQIAARIQKSPAAGIKVTKTYNHNTRKLNLRVATKALAAMPENVGLFVWITEDSLISWQKDYLLTPPADNIEFYTHRHVMRLALNETWGDDLGNIKTGATKTKYYGYTVPAEWNDKHLHAVIALYNIADKSIIQAEEVKLLGE